MKEINVAAPTSWKKMKEKMLAKKHMMGTFMMTLRMWCL